ncbi:hypothetical protein [Cellulophaga sp. Z1A5H]|uniref:hypothetical protein n=1 Tax=Cellulophaga sp. Z1A5H TaxID=2687291 RepID=UPI0013FD2F47|nr:hypothetical protein [Cellulophaga sp. Z1A5H]
MEPTKTIMKGVLWNFEKNKFDSLKDFKKALIRYNETITGDPFKLSLEEPFLLKPEIMVQYAHWDDVEEDEVEPSFLIKANDKKSFSRVELLFKVHNEVCEQLKNEDHKFFEGFDLWEGENPNYPETSLYFLILGS